jgi:hypothetical protein
LSGNAPPSNTAVALSTQPPALGSVGLPGVRAFHSHLISEKASLETHFVFPARHLLWTAAAGPAAIAVTSSAAATPEYVLRIALPPWSHASAGPHAPGTVIATVLVTAVTAA